jgi:hypothetical protein
MTRALATLIAFLALSAETAVAAPYDFDSDGRTDLAVGLPGYQSAGEPDGGAVVVLRGTRRGPVAKDQLITRDTAGVPGVPYGDDALGASLASADFDHDGYADLAVGVPGDRAVYVLRGSAVGLSGVGMQRIELAPPEPEFFSPIHASLAAADFNGDSYADLAIGTDTIRLHVGGRAGVSERPDRVIREPRSLATNFGEVLAFGDVNGDGALDLVEAGSGSAESTDEPGPSGHVVYCPGTADGPRRCRRIFGRRPGPAALAVADVTGDGYGDIVEGVPVIRRYGDDEEVPGAVRLLRGGPRGPRRAMTIHPDSPGVPGDSAGSDQFGASVATGDLDHDGFADIVVGAPGVDNWRGRVTIIRGAAGGYARSGNTAFDESGRGIPGRPRRFRFFGAAVSVLDSDGDRWRDVIVGAPGARDRQRGFGAVTVLRGLRRDLALGRADRITLRRLGISALAAPQTFSPPFGAILGGVRATSSIGESFY